MITEEKTKEYYTALLNRDKNYEGTFYVGVKTTGVFCHSTCPARKPKYENCQFFITADEALLLGFRPCKRCHPLSNPEKLPDDVKTLLSEIDKDRQKKWLYEDFERINITSSYARRQFKKYFNMTFVQYTRALRLSDGLSVIQKGSRVIDAQLEASYASDSGFRDAFKNTFGHSLDKGKNTTKLYSKIISTKIGNMIAISTETHLLILEFINRKGLENEIKKLLNTLNAIVIPETTDILEQTETELLAYFEGKLCEFTVPLKLLGSDFTKSVWHELVKIKYGEQSTYERIAKNLNTPNKIQAIRRANGLNQISIMIPCHRIINADGSLSGYGGGIERKKWLLNHEKCEKISN